MEIHQPNNQTQTHTYFQYSNRGNCTSNQGNNNNDYYRANTMYAPQRWHSINCRMNRSTYNNVNDCRHPYRGSYQYRYPQYRNHYNRQFQGSIYRQGSNRGQQRLQNGYNYEVNVRSQHFNDYMRQNEEYYENTEYKGQIPQPDFQCAQCQEYGHYTHQCEDTWTQVTDLCDSLGQMSLKEEVQNYKYYADNPQQGANFQ